MVRARLTCYHRRNVEQTLLTTGVTTLPIVFLIVLGIVARRSKLLNDAGVEAIKMLVVRIGLPAVYFAAFLRMEFAREYLGIFLMVPAVCFGLLGLGFVARRIGGGNRYAPYLMTGFEFGMLGLALFGSAYGMQNVGVISVIGLPHELFIWFVYVTLLTAQRGGRVSFSATLRSFVTSPVLIAIAAGTAFNAAGAGPWFERAVLGRAVLQTSEYIGGFIIPLILLVVGYGARIDTAGMRRALPLVVLRLLVVGVVALVVVPPIVTRMLGLPQLFVHAMFTFLILPPPFIVPLYMDADNVSDTAYVSNVLSLYTLVAVGAFLLYVMVTV